MYMYIKKYFYRIVNPCNKKSGTPEANVLKDTLLEHGELVIRATLMLLANQPISNEFIH